MCHLSNRYITRSITSHVILVYIWYFFFTLQALWWYWSETTPMQHKLNVKMCNRSEKIKQKTETLLAIVNVKQLYIANTGVPWIAAFKLLTHELIIFLCKKESKTLRYNAGWYWSEPCIYFWHFQNRGT